MKKTFLGLLSILSLPSTVFAAQGGLAAQGAYSSNGFAGGIFVEAICDLTSLMGGSLGALLASSGILMALIAATVGGFSTFRSAVVAAVGAFSISAAVSIFFGTFNCGA